MIKSRNIFAILILLFLAGGCSLWEKDKPNTTPNPIIPREKMISIFGQPIPAQNSIFSGRMVANTTEQNSNIWMRRNLQNQ
jgi:hypothetical protein